MDFLDSIKELGLSSALEPKEFRRLVPIGSDKLLEHLNIIVKENKKVIVDPDYDPDGYFAGLIVKKSFDRLGFRNYDINRHYQKRHGITKEVVIDMIKGGYDYAIILDSSINNMEDIRELIKYGITVIIIDHHKMEYKLDEYPEECVIVHTLSQPGLKYKEVSAGYLTAMTFDYCLSNMGFVENYDFYVMGYLTIYSDSCNLNNYYNQSIIQNIDRFENHIPQMVRDFMTEWDILNRSFVSYKIIPRINSLMRTNKFYLLYRLFYEYDDLAEYERKELLAMIEVVYQDSKITRNNISELVDYTEYDNFVIVYMDSVKNYLNMDYSELRNFTGVVASEISSLTSKLTISLISVNRTMYQGSVRDPFNRDALTVISKLVKAGGHPPAFGIEMNKTFLSTFIKMLKRLNHRMDTSIEDVIVVKGDENYDVFRQMSLMSEYNEISGGDLPVAYVSKLLGPDCRIKRYEKYTSIEWGNIKMSSFLKDVDYMDTILIKPTKSKNGIQYLINTKI